LIKRKSSKQSITPGLPDYTFFTDRDLGHAFPQFLRKAGFHVEVHDDHFSQTTEDIEWFKVVGDKGWIVLSRNYKQGNVTVELDTWMTSKIRGFYIVGKNPFPILAENIVNSRHKITAFLNKHHTPFMAKLYMPPENKLNKTGEIKMWRTDHDWLIKKLSE